MQGIALSPSQPQKSRRKAEAVQSTDHLTSPAGKVARSARRPPGFGKTSYLRALMARLLDSSVFYFVPLAEAQMLSSASFVSFWVTQTRLHEKKQKIAILENAEELLLARDEGSRDKVSNLLNIADGFLGDHLKLHVIATTNVPISKLDPAIVRPGRLLGMREFRRLNRAEALRLAEAKGLKLADQPDYSLAEVYCASAKPDRVEQTTRIGFA
jgi:SpoVK/Ycf46/Vps4 family AAA+-type ATPase